MIERFIIALAIMAVALLAYAVLQWRQRKQAQVALSTETSDSSNSILYFRSDTCAPCVTQKRFLEELQSIHDVHIETVDVEQEPEKAQAFNVLTLPTTIVVGVSGQVKQINYGLTDSTKLAHQLA